MEEKKKKGKEWFIEHKTELVCATVGVVLTIAAVFGVKYYLKTEEQRKLLNEFADNVLEETHSVELSDIITDGVANAAKVCSMRKPHEVRMHPRKLPTGHKPSPEKLAFAAEIDWDLLPGYTLVNRYHTGEVAV